MSPSLVLWAGAAATLVTGAAAELTLDERVNLYINFGATALAPGRYDCKAWVGLFAANGTAAAPGAPFARGSDELMKDCTGTRALFNSLTAVSELVLPVPPGPAPARLAFQWRIVGTKAQGGGLVNIPAVSTMELDGAGKITAAADYFDPSPLLGGAR